MDNPTWIYHKTQEPRIVPASDCAAMYEQGWSDTPATFTGEPRADTDRRGLIRDAISQMVNEGGKSNLTALGKPRMEALESRLGFNVSHSERDSIFEESMDK